MAVHFLNGKFVGEDGLLMPIRDLGFARGYAVFDFFITYPTHRPFMLDAHIDRLFNSAKLIELDVPWKKSTVRQWVLDTLSKNRDTSEKAIKIILSGGISQSLAQEAPTSIAILIDPRHEFPAEYYERGVGVITSKFMRYTPRAKTNNYIEGARMMQLAKKTGAVEPLYWDDTQVFEGASCNVFAVIDGALRTPRSNILPGVTRDVLLKILKIDMPILEEDFTLPQLLGASEVFLTASNKEVMPVVKIDDATVGDGRVGKTTKRAMEQFRDFTHSDAW